MRVTNTSASFLTINVQFKANQTLRAEKFRTSHLRLLARNYDNKIAMPGRSTKKLACDLCCDSFEKGHEILNVRAIVAVMFIVTV